ncbi:MAG TPA: prepilin-type N-terminal cleavage/methylation domain-containing protein [Candidatus Angelobacter sp.]|nr:prepilin-type N-terminal cleavage/methylation domain-containing protein [Candidatus Angelobacter sp.]
MKKKTKSLRQGGFSLLELLMVILLLSIIVGALFSQIERAQVRYRVEDQKLDITQQEREFIDQFTRDLHQAGYPAPTVYGGQYDLTSNFTAAGVWSISDTDLHMEGDVDGTGVVSVVEYSYVAGASPCPCLRRSVTPKQPGLAPSAQVPGTTYTQVENVVPLAGQPIFAAYDASGNKLSSSIPLVNNNGLSNIKSVRITVTTQGTNKDSDTKRDIQVTMTGMARLVNN